MALATQITGQAADCAGHHGTVGGVRVLHNPDDGGDGQAVVCTVDAHYRPLEHIRRYPCTTVRPPQMVSALSDWLDFDRRNG